jgi:predicted molibdopterin-dependent oxidoreductase YjgC
MAPTVKIDGDEYAFTAGETILDVAARNSIAIPTLCYMPEAGHRDVCRLCVVAVEGAKRLLPACSTPATEGMVIDTAGEHVRASRRTTLELLIRSGRHTCITCEALGACELSRLAYEYGVETPSDLPPQDFPMIEDAWVTRDYSKCILCGRCWAACTAIQVHGVVPHPSGRRAERAGGKDWYPLPDLEECSVCGQCIDACPVGALTERSARGLARAWELERIRTTCPHCGMGCQTLVHVKGDEVVKVTGAGDAAPNRGRLCRRGRFAVYEPDERERLTTPLLRRGGKLVPATWDEALDAVAEGLTAAVAGRGPDAVAGLVSPSRTNEDAYQAQKFFRAVIGTNNVDHRSAAASLVPLAEPGSGTTSCYARGALAVLEEARAILVVGDGDIDDYPVAGAAVRRAVREGARLTVLDAGHNTLGEIATTHVSVEPDGIPGVLNGLESVLLAGELAGRSAKGESLPHEREIELLLSAYLPERVAEKSGVAADTIRAMADDLVAIRPAVVLATLGAADDVTTTGASVVRLQALLDDIAGARSVSLPRGGGNAQGMLAMGVAPGLLPGDAFVGNEIAGRRFAEGWGVPAIPTGPGLSTAELLAGLPAWEVEAVWICADDARAFGDETGELSSALSHAGLVIAQGAVLSDLAETAHVVLPSVSWGEEDGTFTNAERRISRVRKVRRPPEGARPGWWIFREVARRMGHDWAATFPEALWDGEIARLIPSLAGVTYAELEQGGLCWPQWPGAWATAEETVVPGRSGRTPAV